MQCAIPSECNNLDGNVHQAGPLELGVRPYPSIFRQKKIVSKERPSHYTPSLDYQTFLRPCLEKYVSPLRIFRLSYVPDWLVE